MDPDPGMGEPTVPQRKDREVLEQVVKELELLKDYVLDGSGKPISRYLSFALTLFINGVASRATVICLHSWEEEPCLTIGSLNQTSSCWCARGIWLQSWWSSLGIILGLMQTFLHGKDVRIKGTGLATKPSTLALAYHRSKTKPSTLAFAYHRFNTKP